MIAAVVSRGSQFHHTPQVGRAQIAPSSTPLAPKSTPTSAEASASASSRQLFRNRYATDAQKLSVSARRPTHTDGTCAYMIRCTSPISRSGGAHASPSHAPSGTSTAATVINPPRTHLPISVLNHPREQSKPETPVHHIEAAQE